MAAKALLVLASALFVQSALSQCLGRMGAGWGYDGLGYEGLGYAGAWNGRVGCGCGGIAPAAELAASHGGGLGVASSSCIPPVGLGVASENVYEGCVGVVGNLPFLGTAAVEGVFPTAGAGAIRYGCGDGAVAITAEGPISGAYAPGIGYAGLGYGAGLGYDAGLGYGAGLGYDAGLGYGAGIGYRGYGLGGCGCGIL